MSNPGFITEIRNYDQKLKILYLDDCETDIEGFKRRIREFNNMEGNKLKNSCRVRVATTSKYDDAFERLVDYGNDEGFNVFVCDQNMPGKQGLDFIKWLIKEDVDVFYVLYSAGVNVNRSIIEECEGNGILFFDKTEQLSTLIEKLIRAIVKDSTQAPEKRINTFSMEDLYYSIAKDIIEDMEKVADTDYHIRVGNKTYKPVYIINELKNKTDFALEYVMNYVEGLKFFNKK
jgi:hypothetical protein